MSERIERIRQHRAQLVQQAAAQRADLTWQIEPWKKRLSYINQAMALTRRVRAHPGLITLALAGLAFIGRHRLGRVIRLGKLMWRVTKFFSNTRR